MIGAPLVRWLQLFKRRLIFYAKAAIRWLGFFHLAVFEFLRIASHRWDTSLTVAFRLYPPWTMEGLNVFTCNPPQNLNRLGALVGLLCPVMRVCRRSLGRVYRRLLNISKQPRHRGHCDLPGHDKAGLKVRPISYDLLGSRLVQKGIGPIKNYRANPIVFFFF